MPVLNWIGKDKVINHDKELPFRVLKPVKELSVGKDSGNLLIEGDNLEALKALMPFYYGKIKCIYIDPPYNTGNEGWIYNDRVNAPQVKSWLNKVVGAEGEDLCRHDKWLCMMYPRIKLLRDLLAEDGAIFISIDDSEQSNLKQIMDEIFNEQNFVANIIWQKKYAASNDAKYFSDNHDFIICYAKNKNENGWIRNLLPRTNKQDDLYKYDSNDGMGLWRPDNLTVKTYSANYDYPIKNPNTGKEYLPTNGRCWVTNKDTVLKWIKEGRVFFGKDGKGAPQLKRYLKEVQQGTVPMTIWGYDEVGHTDEARKELKQIFKGDKSPFPTPKPTRLIKRVLQLTTNKDSLVLDSFAGSGTTGQAVLELNRDDGGRRKFVLIELEKDIAQTVTAKRLKKVIEGYEGSSFPGGTRGGFQYLDLNGELYDQSGFVNPDAKYEDMAAYIYFTETRNYLDIPTIKDPHIGSQGSTHYFLFFENKGNNILDEKTLKKTNDYRGSKVIYADKCLLDDEYLEKNRIIFKQIPYELKKY